MITRDPATHGAILIPIILSSDKMTVSVATGQHNYYLLYLSIGNLHNTARCAHKNSVRLVAFLAMPKSKYNSLLIYNVHFHAAYTYQPQRSMQRHRHFESSGASSSTNHSQRYSIVCGHSWKHGHSRNSLTATFVGSYTHWGLTLQTTKSKCSYRASCETGV